MCSSLNNSHIKELKSIENGDKILYKGNRGTLKTVDNRRCVIEIDVPLFEISKDKSK